MSIQKLAMTIGETGLHISIHRFQYYQLPGTMLKSETKTGQGYSIM
jgi:hypothetical protein